MQMHVQKIIGKELFCKLSEWKKNQIIDKGKPYRHVPIIYDSKTIKKNMLFQQHILLHELRSILNNIF